MRRLEYDWEELNFTLSRLILSVIWIAFITFEKVCLGQILHAELANGLNRKVCQILINFQITTRNPVIHVRARDK